MLCEIKKNRVVVLDSKKIKLKNGEYLLEICLKQIINGYPNPLYFFASINVQNPLNKKNEDFKEEDAKSTIYYIENDQFEQSNKRKLLNLIKWIGNSIIYSYDAQNHINNINLELNIYGLNEIPFQQFRCLKKIFIEIIPKIDPSYNINNTSLEDYARYFGYEPNIIEFKDDPLDTTFIISNIILLLEKKIDGNKK